MDQASDAVRAEYSRSLAAAAGGDAYDKVEASRVLLFVFAVLVFVIALELFLHFLEHATKRKKKYADMLHKTTQELMIVGLIYLLVKFCVSTGLAKKNGLVYQAMDFADLLILFTVLAMVLQATVILFRLRKDNRELGKVAILSTEHVVLNAKRSMEEAKQQFCLRRYMSWAKYEYHLQIKLLRSLFVRTYGLPQLFPFDKYVEDVQDSQVAHLIEIDITIWVILMATYALFFTLSGELFDGGDFKATTPVRWGIFAGFAGSLFVLMLLLLGYLNHLVELLLQHAAQQADVLGVNWSRRPMNNPDAMFDALGHVVRNEAEIPYMTPQQSIDAMRHIADDLSDDAHGGGHHHHGGSTLSHIFSHDMLCQLIGSVCRRAKGTSNAPKGKLRTDSLKLPYFSRKFCHFLIQLLFILNGFYYALFLNCVMYLDGFNPVAVAKSLAMLLPLLLNTFVLAPKITREFSVINGVFRVDAKKLSAIVEHFAEVEATKTEMVRQVLEYLHHHGQAVADIEAALAAADSTDDDAGDGFIDMDVMRGVLKQFGFRFQRQKFTMFVRLQFETKGATLRYGDLIRLLSTSETESVHMSKMMSQHHPPQQSQHLQPRSTDEGRAPSITDGVEPRARVFKTQETTASDAYFV
ncbi:Aste57867_25171 [Aphanomyces stellatus]|uniref:Aste57867_25171 protein n=1 Tax=Aphanomyces stellatus TaxID=120398 RepID=A0A485LTC5_9STRA|nr:hypothetical protein As57867_025093 [Aphanomyces stellatus]VFU01800.1 Aste57867_25171 [Aphanomyces stellatus]